MPPLDASSVYPYLRRNLDRITAKLKAELTLKQFAKVREFLEHVKAQGVGEFRIRFYAQKLLVIARALGPKFLHPDKHAITRFLNDLESKGLEAWTQTGYRVTVKRFYKWLLGNDEEYPEVVRWVKTRLNGTKSKLPDSLITPAELKAMVKACINPRDRALISFLYDSGCRIREVLTLDLGSVTFDQYGAVCKVRGKTGDRRVRIIGDSVPLLSAWLDAHPDRENPRAPLFVGLDSRTRELGMNYAAARKALLTAATKAKIKKRIHPHLFRHTAATRLAAKVAEAPLEAQLGWVHGSSMARIYVHLSGRDVDRAILGAAGIEMEDDPGKGKESLPRDCPRCKASNVSDARFCRTCGLALEIRAALELKAAEEAPDDFLKKLLSRPEARAMVKEIAREERASSTTTSRSA